MEQGNVFVTGATGFLGGVLVCKLLLKKPGEIYCLVRPREGQSPRQRLHSALLRAAEMASIPHHQIAPELTRVHAVEGDIKQRWLGLSDAERERLQSSKLSAIWHSAAYLRFEEEYRRKVFEQNVTGTECVFEFAKAIGIPEFNYISTAYVAGERAGEVPETSCVSSLAYPVTNPYEESKRITEQYLEKECASNGIYLRILRPSIIIGSSSTYESTSDFSFYGFLYGFDRFVDWVKNRVDGYYDHFPVTLYTEPDNVHDFIPVDVVAEEAVEISEQRLGSPEYHHLTNPYPVSIDTLVKGSKRAFPGIEMKVTHERDELSTLDHLFRKKLYFYQPYFFDSKYYRRRKPLNPKFKKINYTAHEIYKYGDHFLNDSRKRLFREKRLLDVVLPDFTRHQGVSFDAVPYQYIASGHHDVVEQEEVTMLLCPLGVGVGVWESLADTLRKKTKVVIWDNPLLLTEQPGAEAMLAAYVANARAVLKLENAKRARLIAFDSSLVQALALARAFPQLVSRIVAISPFIPQLNRERDELCPREEKLRELIEEYRRFDAKPGEYFELVAEAIADNFALRKIEHKLPAFSSYMAQIPRKHRSLFVAPFLNSTTLRNFELWMRAPGVFGAAEAFDGVTVPGTVCLSGEREGVRYGAEQSWNVQRLSAPSEWIPVDVDPEFLISLIDSVSRAERTQRDPVPCAV